MTPRLISTVDRWRDDCRSHHFKLLRGHQSGCILGSNNIDFYAHIRSCVQNLTRGRPHSIGIEDLLNRRQPLIFMRYLFGSREDLRNIDAQNRTGDCLKLLSEDDRIGAFSANEFELLRRQRCCNICLLYTSDAADE